MVVHVRVLLTSCCLSKGFCFYTLWRRKVKLRNFSCVSNREILKNCFWVRSYTYECSLRGQRFVFTWFQVEKSCTLSYNLKFLLGVLASANFKNQFFSVRVSFTSMGIPHWWNIIFPGFSGGNVPLVSVARWWWKFSFKILPLGSGETFKHVRFVTYSQKTILFCGRVVKLSVLLGCSYSLFSRGSLKDFEFLISAYERLHDILIGVFYKSDLFVIRSIVQWNKNHKF